jgi:hypothetical protein
LADPNRGAVVTVGDPTFELSISKTGDIFIAAHAVIG